MKTIFSIATLILVTLTVPVLANDKNATMENFRQADANGDKALNNEEFRAFIDLNAEDNLGRARLVKSRNLYSMAFGRLDKNKDGKITADELGNNTTASSSTRGMRYCEILLVHEQNGKSMAEVWGTQSLNLCPEKSWRSLDPARIQKTWGASAIIMNGPRFKVVDGSSGMDLSGAEQRRYGDLDMIRLATVALGETGQRRAAYQPITVLRTNTWMFKAGSEIYQLTAPDGTSYVMQAYSQIVDPQLRETDLAKLGERLQLPEGWVFSNEVLAADLNLHAKGKAIVIQDELQNTYQRRNP